VAHSAERTVDIDVPAELFYELITDFDSYPDFLSDVLATEVTKRDNGIFHVRFTVRVLKKFDYVLRLEGKPYESLRWHLLEPGLFQSNDGGWHIESLTETSIRVTYDLAVTVSRFVPHAITQRLVEVTLPEMLEQWKVRAEARYAAMEGRDDS
jgi:coenzyme Q-binding protein COQ10